MYIKFKALKTAFIICLSLLIMSGCKERETGSPEFEIASVEVSPDYIAVGNKTLLKALTDRGMVTSHDSRYRWQIEEASGLIKDTLTHDYRLYWTAPSESGEYIHSVTMETQSGEPLSENYSFSVMVDPGHLKNGNTIVFSKRVEGAGNQIFTMDEDESNLKQLTSILPGSAIKPSWSPDGNQILFTSHKNGTSHSFAIWIMEADGSNQRILYSPDPDNPNELPIQGSFPRWSPDGTKVVFELCWSCGWSDGYSIGVFDRLTMEFTRTTKHWEILGHPASDYKPFWSSDGKQIAFASDRDYVTGDSLRYRTDLYIINANGSGLKRITENGRVMNPIWSNADDQNTIFVRFRHFLDAFESGVYSVNIQTGETRLIKKDPSENIILSPIALSPDGSQLVMFAEKISSSRIHTVYLLDIKKGTMEEVFSAGNLEPRTLGLDWYFYDDQ